MTFEAFEQKPPTFNIFSEYRLTPEEVRAQYGDPTDNTHHEENRGQYLELVSDSGLPYQIRLGLPEPAIIGADGALKLYEPSEEPHVFVSDRFRLQSNVDMEPLMDEAGLRVLHTHGRWDGNAWVPSGEVLREKGVTIPSLLSAFEKATGWPIDVLWVCQFDADGGSHPITTDTNHPYIYPVSGFAQGTVRLCRGEIDVTLVQAADENTEIAYQDWLTAHQAQR